nr:hypothetical protein CFP56_54858 [Quercus suber]
MGEAEDYPVTVSRLRDPAERFVFAPQSSDLSSRWPMQSNPVSAMLPALPVLTANKAFDGYAAVIPDLARQNNLVALAEHGLMVSGMIPSVTEGSNRRLISWKSHIKTSCGRK